MTQAIRLFEGDHGRLLEPDDLSADNLYLKWDPVQRGWVPAVGGGGGGDVQSVFSRTGVVTAQAGDYGSDLITNQSLAAGSSVTAALNFLRSLILGLTTGVSSVFGRAGAVTAQAGDYTAPQVSATAGPRIVGRWAASAGALQEAALDGGLEVNSGNTGPQVATTLPVRGTENVSSDAWPPLQQQGAINTGGSVTGTVAIPLGKSVDISFRCQVDDSGTGANVAFYLLLVTAHNVGGVVSIIVNQMIASVPGAGFSFSAAVVGTDIVATLANASGTNRTYNLIAGRVLQDKP